MWKKEEIKEQRVFGKLVEIRIKEMGLLYKFVAQNIGISSARLSQYTNNFRKMPMKVRLDLIRYLRMEEQITPPKATKAATKPEIAPEK